MLTIKNASLDPPRAPNDGSASVRIVCEVSASPDEAEKTAVWTDLSSLKGSSKQPLILDPEPGPRRAGAAVETTYSCRVEVPLLADPGTYELSLLASLPGSEIRQAKAALVVQYRRPDYQGGLVAPENQEILARVAQCDVVRGNHIEVLLDGQTALRRRLELIEGAKRQINFQAYTLDGEGQSGEIVAALLDQARQGIEVNVVLNPYPQFATSPWVTLRLRFQAFLADLQAAGRKRERERERQASKKPGSGAAAYFQEIGLGPDPAPRGLNLLLFDTGMLRAPGAGGPRSEGKGPPVWLQKEAAARVRQGQEGKTEVSEWLTSFQGPGGLPALPLLDYAIHEKILVVDGERAIAGGRNLDDRYFTHWIDKDLYLEGPIVGRIQRGFLRSFSEFSAGNGARSSPTVLVPDSPPRGRSGAQFVQSRPWLGEVRTLEALVTAMQMARSRIWASSQYLVLPDSLLRDALLDAAGRGVDVRILTNSFNTCREVAFSAGYLISLNYFRDLIDAGIRIYELNGTEDENAPQPYYHVKEFLIDGEMASIGSFNLSIRSCFIESENLLNLYDPDLVAAQERLFLDRIENEARPVTPEHLARQIELHRGGMDMARYAELLY